MTVKELKKLLDKYPEDAIVYIEADHGQSPEQAYNVTPSHSEPIYCGEEMFWDGCDPEIELDEDNITAICIG